LEKVIAFHFYLDTLSMDLLHFLTLPPFFLCLYVIFRWAGLSVCMCSW